ncbi:MAG: type IV pilus twitching motility protein PilT [Dehalococcoidia bacterium]|nr:MAG: type IV pilus twitching motility protein PilT [Dehalococcoidia bacterium]
MNIIDMLNAMIETKASDLHLIKGIPPVMRVYGDLVYLNKEPLIDSSLMAILNDTVRDENRRNLFMNEKEYDFAYELGSEARFRFNLYFQMDSIAFSIRHVPMKIPRLEDLNLPKILRELIKKQNGLILVTGPTGSGKSTTLAAMIDLINQEQSLHIVTVEDPIEYVYKQKKSIISQREVGSDTQSFASALKHVLRQDPDVILIGEIRDLETMQAGITAAETGHLVFSTLHTTSSSQTIDRIIDIFPPHQQSQIRSQIAITLQAVVTQRLVKRIDMKGRIPTTEILIATPAIRSMIREGKTQQIYPAIEMGREYGMHTMEQGLNELVNRKVIKKEDTYGGMAG